MKSFSLSCDFFLLGGINFLGSLLLLLLFSFIPMEIWEPLNAVWQFLFLLFFLGILFGVTPTFLTTIRKKYPDTTVVCESFGWVPYVYVAAFTTLAGLDIFGQFRVQFSPIGMWLTVIVPVVISLIILYRTTKCSFCDDADTVVIPKNKIVKERVADSEKSVAVGKTTANVSVTKRVKKASSARTANKKSKAVAAKNKAKGATKSRTKVKKSSSKTGMKKK